MNRDQFWALVDQIGWGTRTTDCATVEKMLLKRFTRIEAEEVRDHLEECWNAVYKALVEAEVHTGSDDGFCDLCYHIVGLGRDEWQRNIDNPNLAKTRANADNYVESFGYCFPCEDSYDSLDVARYVERADEMVTKYTEAQKKRFCGSEKQLVVSSMMLLRDENVTEFIATREQTEAAAEKIAEEGRWRIEQLLGAMPVVDGGSVFNPWMVKNLYSDVDRYIVNF